MKMKAIEIIEKGFVRYGKVKITSCGYCQACDANFNDLEIVFYAPLDNDVVCRECACAHEELEPRLYIGRVEPKLHRKRVK